MIINILMKELNKGSQLLKFMPKFVLSIFNAQHDSTST